MSNLKLNDWVQAAGVLADETFFTHTFHSYEFFFYLRWLRADSGVAAASASTSIDTMAATIHRNPGAQTPLG